MEYIKRIIGAIIGGAIGSAIYYFAATKGVVVPLVTGFGIGMGAELFASHRSKLFGNLLAIPAILFLIYLEWKIFPFVTDDSLSYFVKNITSVSWMSKFSIFGGAIAAAYFGMGKGEKVSEALPELSEQPTDEDASQ